MVVEGKQKDGSPVRQAFYTRSGSGGTEGPSGRGLFVPIDGHALGWYAKTRHFYAASPTDTTNEDWRRGHLILPEHMQRYGNDTLKVIGRTLDAIGRTNIGGHEDASKDAEIYKKYMAFPDTEEGNMNINKLVGSRHALSFNEYSDSKTYKDTWRHYKNLIRQTRHNSIPQLSPEGVKKANEKQIASTLKWADENPKDVADMWRMDAGEDEAAGLSNEQMVKYRNSFIDKYMGGNKKKFNKFVDEHLDGKLYESGKEYPDVTKQMEKHTEEYHTVEHISEEKPFSMDAAKESLDEQLEQIKNKIETGDYNIKKSNDIFL